MRHIADHYSHLERVEHSGPDFFVIEYMHKKRIISNEDYKWATRHTERPDCDGLVDFGHKTEEMIRKEERREALAEVADDRKHRRYLRVKRKGNLQGDRSSAVPNVMDLKDIADDRSTVSTEEDDISKSARLSFPDFEKPSPAESIPRTSSEDFSSLKDLHTEVEMNAVEECPISSPNLATEIPVDDSVDVTRMGKDEHSHSQLESNVVYTSMPDQGPHDVSTISVPSDPVPLPDKCLMCLQTRPSVSQID